MFCVVRLDCKKQLLVPTSWIELDSYTLNYGLMGKRAKNFYSLEMIEPKFNLDVYEKFNENVTGCYSGIVIDVLGKIKNIKIG